MEGGRRRVVETPAVTAALRRVHLRDPVIRAGLVARRARRRAFERLGSTRYSHPALFGIDVTLDGLLGAAPGIFVEAGGHDGYTQSNTYFLERFRDWRGVLVEPVSLLAAEARRNRPQARVVQCALVAPDQAGTSVEIEFGDLMSSLRGTHEPEWAAGGLAAGWRDGFVERVPARTLSEVLDECGVTRVDLLSLDVEGHEAQVLAGLDRERHRPAWILVEMHDLERGRAEVGPLLGDGYAEHLQVSPLDVLYRSAGG
jgi:FkbM family methyltransferase